MSEPRASIITDGYFGQTVSNLLVVGVTNFSTLSVVNQLPKIALWYDAWRGVSMWCGMGGLRACDKGTRIPHAISCAAELHLALALVGPVQTSTQ